MAEEQDQELEARALRQLAESLRTLTKLGKVQWLGMPNVNDLYADLHVTISETEETFYFTLMSVTGDPAVHVAIPNPKSLARAGCGQRDRMEPGATVCRVRESDVF